MGKVKIDIIKLKRMVREGKSLKHIAFHFKVSEVAIRQRLKAMDIVVGRSLAMDSETVNRLTKEHFNAVEELQKVHAVAANLLETLDKAVQGETPLEELSHILGERGSLGKLYLETLAEVRKQLHLAAEMSKSLYSIQEVQKFQETVIEVLKDADPAIARKIVERLVEHRALCSSLSLT